MGVEVCRRPRPALASWSATAVGTTVRALAATRSAAVDRLHGLLGSENESIALRAAIALLRTSVSYEDLYEVSRKLSALEAVAAELLATETETEMRVS